VCSGVQEEEKEKWWSQEGIAGGLVVRQHVHRSALGLAAAEEELIRAPCNLCFRHEWGWKNSFYSVYFVHKEIRRRTYFRCSSVIARDDHLYLRTTSKILFLVVGDAPKMAPGGADTIELRTP